MFDIWTEARSFPFVCERRQVCLTYNSTMATFACLSCGREFATLPACQQHASAKGHRAPTPAKCDTCNQNFTSVDALKVHYRDSDAHPTCSKCQDAFKDTAALSEHMSTTHLVRCVPCNLTFYREDLQKHYQESPNHSKCTVCNLGFPNATTHKEHMLSKHSQTYCASCMRYFKTVGALGDHYRDSPVHPRCSPCDLGFKDKAAYDEHMAAEHPPKPTVVASPVQSIRSMIDTRDQPTIQSLPSTSETQSLPASPVLRASTGSDVRLSLSATPDTVASELRNNLVPGSPPSLFRAVSEPTPRPTSVLGVSSTIPQMSDGLPSPAISNQTLDYMSVNVTGSHRPASVISMLSTSLKSISSATSTRPSIPTEAPVVVQCPLPLQRSESSASSASASSGLRTPESEPRIRGAQSVLATPKAPSSSVLATTSETTTRRATQTIDTPSSRAPSRAASRVSRASRAPSVVSRVSGASTASETPLTTPSSYSQATDSDATARETTNVSARALHATASRPVSKGLSWHCRACLKDPCDQPTATMCGHIFCHSCILKELAVNMQCPVCRKVMLLRLHVEN